MNKYYVYALLDPRKAGNYIYDNYKFDYEPFYIGKGSGNRYKSHLQKNKLEKNSPKNNKIKKIHEQKFSVITKIIMDKLSESESLVLERKLISQIGRYDLNEGVLCNMTDGGEGGYRANRSKFQIKIDKIDLNRNITITYNSLKEACELNGIKNKGNIIKCCQGKILHYKNNIWEYNDIKLKTKYKKCYDNLKNKNKIVQYLENGEKLIFDSVKLAAEYNNVSSTCVIYSCKGITGKKSKYNFEYFHHEKSVKYKNKRSERNNPCLKEIPIIQLDLNNNFIKEWSSSTQASRQLKFNSSCISGCCRHKRKTAYGYKWVYKDEYI